MLKSRAVYKATEAHLSSIIEDVSTLLDRKTKQKMLDIASILQVLLIYLPQYVMSSQKCLTLQC